MDLLILTTAGVRGGRCQGRKIDGTDLSGLLALDHAHDVFFAHHEQLVALDVKPGDKVLFGKYSGQTVKVKGEELLVMREEDIMGVIEGA